MSRRTIVGAAAVVVAFAIVERSASPARVDRIAAFHAVELPRRPVVQRPDLVPTTPARVNDEAPRAALLVALDNAPGSPPLPGSRADAHTMRRALLMYGFEPDAIVTLADATATRASVFAAIDRIVATSRDDGITVLAFAAHSFRAAGGAPTMRLWDGRVAATDLATRLAPIRGRVWSVFATCYAGGYQLPGIVGANRVTVFASEATETSLQLGDAGSFVVLYMARYAMLDGGSPRSVESAFRYSRAHIALAHAQSVPTMDDRLPGELVLGPYQRARRTMPVRPAPRAASAREGGREGVQDPSPSPKPLVGAFIDATSLEARPSRSLSECSPAKRACRTGPSA